MAEWSARRITVVRLVQFERSMAEREGRVVVSERGAWTKMLSKKQAIARAWQEACLFTGLISDERSLSRRMRDEGWTRSLKPRVLKRATWKRETRCKLWNLLLDILAAKAHEIKASKTLSWHLLHPLPCPLPTYPTDTLPPSQPSLRLRLDIRHSTFQRITYDLPTICYTLTFLVDSYAFDNRLTCFSSARSIRRSANSLLSSLFSTILCNFTTFLYANVKYSSRTRLD